MEINIIKILLLPQVGFESTTNSFLDTLPKLEGIPNSKDTIIGFVSKYLSNTSLSSDISQDHSGKCVVTGPLSIRYLIIRLSFIFYQSIRFLITCDKRVTVMYMVHVVLNY